MQIPKKMQFFRLIGKIGILTILLIAAILVLVPLIWVFSSSFKSPAEIYSYPITWIPQPVRFENYLNAFKAFPLVRYLLNSTIVAGSVTLANLLFSSLAGYSLSKFKYPGRNLIFVIIVAMLIVPRDILAIPTFLVARAFGLANTYIGLMVPVLSAPIAIFIMRQNMQSIPNSLIEVARMDGAGEFRIFFTIILPLSKAALIAMGIVMYIFSWNEFFWPLVILGDPNKYTVPLGLSLLTDIHAHDFQLIFPAVIIALTPTVIVYALLQRYFIKGFATSGIKG